MTNVTTHKTIDEAGAETVLDAAERHALRARPPGRDRRRRALR